MEAQLWKPLRSERVVCHLCAHCCIIDEGARGRCGVRHNQHGVLHTLVGDMVAALHVDPVEKKPLFHYLPGTTTFSLGTMGCNLGCSFCQNHELSRTPATTGRVQGRPVSPAQLVDAAVQSGAKSIAFTYSEPTVFYELMTATADIALAQGLGTIMVSNGFQSPQALAGLQHRICAANIDLKAFSEKFYQDQCGARLAPVLDNLKTMVAFGWWVEITTLLIPGLNDGDDELRNIARFIHNELGAHVPWHLSRYHPAYRLHLPPTPTATLERAWHIGREEGLAFVYLGNVPGHVSETTFCPSCASPFARRVGFKTTLPHSAQCAQCGTTIPGIGWE